MRTTIIITVEVEDGTWPHRSDLRITKEMFQGLSCDAGAWFKRVVALLESQCLEKQRITKNDDARLSNSR